MLAFELDVGITGWRHPATASSYFDTWFFPALIVHLFTTIPTLLFWIFSVDTAISAVAGHGLPTTAIKGHKLLGRAATIVLRMTSVTG